MTHCVVVPFALASSCLPLLTAEAWAGAFNQEAGQLQAILTTTTANAQDYVQDTRTIRPVRFQKVERSLLFEFGYSKWLTLIVKPTWLSANLTDRSQSQSFTNFGPTTLGGQISLATLGPDNVVALQGLLHMPSKAMRLDSWLVGQTHVEPELRIMLGVPTSLRSMPAFMDLEVGYRHRSGGPPSEWHIEITTGIRPRSDLLMLTQTFLTRTGPSTDLRYPAYLQRKIQTSIVKDFGGFSLQAGAFRTDSARNAYVERGTIFALWLRF
jgi:hypothetical protein